MISVGTELLLGQIVNTNSRDLSLQCAALGVNVYYQTVVGDNEMRLRETIETAHRRSDVVILTGGLGPTQDDLTKDVLAAFVQRPLVLHEPSLEHILSLFEGREGPLIESNKRQALMIEGCDPLPNDTGLAVGNALTYEGVHYIVLPGPPREMNTMFNRYASAWLRRVMNEEAPLYSRMLKFAGIGESALEQQLIDLIESQSDPTIAPYAKEGEVTVRVTTRAQSEAEADEKMAAALAEIRNRLGGHLYAERDITLEEAIMGILAERGETMATAESCTGGLIAEQMTSIPGSSAVFAGGIVCYTNAVKHRYLQVPMETLEGPEAPGAVSAETAEVLAHSILHSMTADYALSVTGVAGPDPSEGKPVGTVYIGLAKRASSRVEVRQLALSGTREVIRLRAAKAALYWLWQDLTSR